MQFFFLEGVDQRVQLQFLAPVDFLKQLKGCSF